MNESKLYLLMKGIVAPDVEAKVSRGVHTRGMVHNYFNRFHDEGFPCAKVKRRI